MANKKTERGIGPTVHIDNLTEALKPKRGRPPSNQPRVWMRVDPGEFAEWTAEADRLGMGVSSWMRMTCNAAARAKP